MNRYHTAAMAVAVLVFAAAGAGAQARGESVPAGQMPPAGMCRVWVDGVPPGHQPRATDCATARANRTANSHVIYGGDVRNGTYDPRYPRTVNDPRYPSANTDPRYDPRSGTYDPRYDPRSGNYDPRYDARSNVYDPRYDSRSSSYDPRLDPRSRRYDQRYAAWYNARVLSRRQDRRGDDDEDRNGDDERDHGRKHDAEREHGRKHEDRDRRPDGQSQVGRLRISCAKGYAGSAPSRARRAAFRAIPQR